MTRMTSGPYRDQDVTTYQPLGSTIGLDQVTLCASCAARTADTNGAVVRTRRGSCDGCITATVNRSQALRSMGRVSR